MIRVLIVEDSPVARETLLFLINSTKDIRVVSVAHNGKEAIVAAIDKKPDVIVMDINMPKMNGFQAAREIMEKSPRPIIIVTASYDVKDVSTVFKALEAGAVAIKPKPFGIKRKDTDEIANDLLRTIRIMSEVKVVRRKHGNIFKHNEKEIEKTDEIQTQVDSESIYKALIIGASTGGPQVIMEILSNLPQNFKLPVLIVQHISAGFIEGFVEWLNTVSKLPVNIAVNNEPLIPGKVYVAPDDFHLGVNKACNKIILSQSPKENGLRPAVSYLFRNARDTFREDCIAVLLSGMGKDGAMDLKLLRDTGAITIVQDEESSVVFGMPGEAVKLDGASFILNQNKIANKIIELLNN
jgi:two-component system chemotaxis response regulator CheB